MPETIRIESTARVNHGDRGCCNWSCEVSASCDESCEWRVTLTAGKEMPVNLGGRRRWRVWRDVAFVLMSALTDGTAFSYDRKTAGNTVLTLFLCCRLAEHRVSGSRGQ